MSTINYKRDSKDSRFFIPELEMEKPLYYGKYGQMRLDYLKEYRQDKYTYYLMNGLLQAHLNEVDEQTNQMIKNQIKVLRKRIPAPNQDDTLAWTGYMNSLKQIAEEVVLPMYVYN